MSVYFIRAEVLDGDKVVTKACAIACFDNADDAARCIQGVDYKLGAKSYPAWFRSLVDDEVK